jgi:predicted enzyme related to lactoylglutathione lyase
MPSAPNGARLNYVELPAGNIAASRAFFQAAFGWSLAEYGPDYAATVGQGCDLGLHGDVNEAVSAPLAVIEVDDLEGALKAVEGAGGTIVRPVFAFPGGRRFHFREPSGNEMAVYINEPG